MKIALAQINATVGAIPRNGDLVIETLERARAAGADLAVFPELALTGYPPLDLLDRPSFITRNLEALERVAAATGNLPAAVVGFVQRDPTCEGKGPPKAEEGPPKAGKGLYNAAALCAEGKVRSIHCKTLLPTYDVFDEARYFDSARENRVAEFQGMRLGISICEDIWNDALFWGRLSGHRQYDEDPIEGLVAQGCDLLINVAASPFTEGKRAVKREMFAAAARRHRLPLLHVNLVGGNDSLIFDGWSNVFDPSGEIVAQARDFAESLPVWEWPTGSVGPTGPVDADVEGKGRARDAAPPGPFEETTTEEIASICEALTLGVGDYVRKTGFQSAVIGLSGGIDSAVTAALAVRALGADRVLGVSMPSQYSSQHSQDDARSLAGNLGIAYKVIPIRGTYDAYLETLGPHFDGRPFDIAEENIQARIRGNILMALSNKLGHLVLSTGNKSEMAVGYCTLYGDMSGGLAVLSDVPKTMVYKLAEFLNRRGEVIPASTIAKAPSAELRPGQFDQDSLPPYEVLDPIIRAFVEEGLYSDEITARGFDRGAVDRTIGLIERNEYKRRQAAIGLKVTRRAFGYGRRMPVARGKDAP
ncbi:MAG TPA: NAD+ synthase [Sumerlaeia bacterium]|nr:NAD+ synthase [Sumerlaeia bacterium]